MRSLSRLFEWHSRADKARARVHFENAAWPVPDNWTARPTPHENYDILSFTQESVCVVFRDRDTEEYKGRAKIAFGPCVAKIQQLFIEADAQEKGHGKKLAAFVLDELKGVGYTRTKIHAVRVGAYFWVKAGVVPNRLSVCVDVAANLVLERRDLFTNRQLINITAQLACVFFGIGSRQRRLWKLCDDAFGKKLFLDTDWHGKFDNRNTASVQRLKAYTGYAFKYL